MAVSHQSGLWYSQTMLQLEVTENIALELHALYQQALPDRLCVAPSFIRRQHPHSDWIQYHQERLVEDTVTHLLMKSVSLQQNHRKK
eukprot:1672458-Amphidinium_carterae.2